MYRSHINMEAVNSRKLAILEVLIAVVALVLLLSAMAPRYLSQMPHGPRVDIGYTTQNSVIVLFKEKKNPYASEFINIRPELKPEHRGFHYGPGMLFGYSVSAFWPDVGYKICNLIYFCVALTALVLLVNGVQIERAGVWRRISGGVVVAFLFLLPERLWYEIFTQGANDIFPVALILVGLVFVQRQMWLAAGILLGLSFATKFSPAAFLLVLFLRREIEWRFLLGCVVGSFPLLAFAVWDFRALFENVFVLRFTLGYDSTSLYSITPKSLHYIFPLAQVLMIVVLLVRNFYRPIVMDTMVMHFAILLVVVEVTFKEIHANHLVWFYPLFAYLAVQYRHQFWATLSTIFRPAKVS